MATHFTLCLAHTCPSLARECSIYVRELYYLRVMVGVHKTMLKAILLSIDLFSAKDDIGCVLLIFFCRHLSERKKGRIYLFMIVTELLILKVNIIPLFPGLRFRIHG
jgi:hypothetical protein